MHVVSVNEAYDFFCRGLGFICAPCVKRKKTLTQAPPAGILLLILWLYFSWIETIVGPMFSKIGFVWGTAQFLSLTICFVLLVWCFVLSWKTVPPAMTADLSRYYEENHIRNCRKCGYPKPARTHHCSTCERCVPRMDHHCIWVGNCVGHHNHKYFILFLFYICATCSQAVFTWGLVIDEPWLPAKAFLVGVFCLILTVAIGIFGSAHIAMIFSNRTSLECLDRCCDSKPMPSYSRGIPANWCEIMGDDPKCWLLPVGIPKLMHYPEPQQRSEP